MVHEWRGTLRTRHQGPLHLSRQQAGAMLQRGAVYEGRVAKYTEAWSPQFGGSWGEEQQMEVKPPAFADIHNPLNQHLQFLEAVRDGRPAPVSISPAGCAICGWWRRSTNRRAPAAQWSDDGFSPSPSETKAQRETQRPEREHPRRRIPSAIVRQVSRDSGSAARDPPLRDSQSRRRARADVRRRGNAGDRAHRARGRRRNHRALAGTLQVHESAVEFRREMDEVYPLAAEWALRWKLPGLIVFGFHKPGATEANAPDFPSASAARADHRVAGGGGRAGRSRRPHSDDRARADLLVR